MAQTNYLTIPTLSEVQIKRIINKIKIDTKTGCWNWIGCLRSGYGQVRIDKTLYIVHRLMYSIFITPPPNGKGKNIPVIDHICNNKSCCNPSHLRLISDIENILIGNGATAKNFRKTHCRNGHLLPPPINGHRRCMICHRAWNRSNYAKNPEKFISKVCEYRSRKKKL